MLNLISMANEHITAGTVSICVIECDKVFGINVDKEGQFALTCLGMAIWGIS